MFFDSLNDDYDAYIRLNKAMKRNCQKRYQKTVDLDLGEGSGMIANLIIKKQLFVEITRKDFWNSQKKEPQNCLYGYQRFSFS